MVIVLYRCDDLHAIYVIVYVCECLYFDVAIRAIILRFANSKCRLDGLNYTQQLWNYDDVFDTDELFTILEDA